MKTLSINYRLPIFGDQKIQFRAESAQLFKWLEKNNEIRRLMNIDQLGVLKRRFSCAHHSKFEYAIMLSYLIEMIKQDEEFKLKYSLSRPYEEKNKRVLSSISELLKCWAFLLPIGHLHGTFPHERAFLRILNANKDIHSDFLTRFNAYPRIQGQVKSIVNNDDYYRLHQAFAILKLHDSKTSLKRKDITKRDKALINKYIKYLGFYVDPTKSVFKRAKTIFSDLRKIAYVLLDSYYCNLMFSFNANHISQETIKASLRGEEGGNYISALWNSLDNYLMKELYKNTQCLLIENLAYRAFFTRLHKEKKDIDFLINQLWESNSGYMDKTFNDYLTKFKVNLHQDCEYYEVLNLSIAGLRLFDIESRLDESRKVINGKSKVAYLNYVVDKNIKTRSTDIYIYLKHRKRIRSNLPLAKSLVNLLIRLCILSQKQLGENIPVVIRKFLTGKDGHLGAYYSILGAGNWNKLILFMVKLAIKSKYALRAVSIDKNIRFDAMLLDKKGIKKITDYFINKVKNQELEDLIKLASDVMERNKQQSIRGRLIIYPFNIKIVSKQNKVEEGDIDSILVNFVPNKLIELYMLQSKAKGQRYQDSRKQATRTKRMLISRLGVRTKSSIFRLSNKSKASVLKINLS
jgi:hypothetical protein